MKVSTKKGGGPKRGYLDGQMLIAMPAMRDERFARSLIYVCAHSSEGAMGIIVNRRAGSIDFPELLVQLDIIKKSDQIKLPENAETLQVLKGGPVDTGRGFVLHSSDFFIKDATLKIDDGICLTATVDILKAIAKGAGIGVLPTYVHAIAARIVPIDIGISSASIFGSLIILIWRGFRARGA